jgi:hypothetical protein
MKWKVNKSGTANVKFIESFICKNTKLNLRKIFSIIVNIIIVY